MLFVASFPLLEDWKHFCCRQSQSWHVWSRSKKDFKVFRKIFTDSILAILFPFLQTRTPTSKCLRIPTWQYCSISLIWPQEEHPKCYAVWMSRFSEFAAGLMQRIGMQMVYKNCYTFISVKCHICAKFNLSCMLKVSLLWNI